MLFPKEKRGAYRRKRKRDKKKAHREAVQTVRPAIFAASGGICVCCGVRRAESMHEEVPRSLGGKVSLDNSIPVCGSGTTKCHGFLQRNAIKVTRDDEGRRVFTPTTRAAIAWMAQR
jgi:hypothetical protein